MGVFEGLAAEAIEQCLGNLLSAKDLIKERKGFVDSQLFLIKHLLTLREQVAPFEASFTETQVSLDFSSAKAELRKLLAGGGGIGQLLTPNVFVPQVSTSTVDSLQKVVRTLTAAVEEFVVHVTKTLAGDLLSFLVQVSSFEKVSNSNSNSNGEAQLKDQAWAAPACLERIAQDTTAALREKAPMIAQELLVYMPQAQAGTIFSPIRDSIVDSWEQFLLVRNKVCQSGEGDGSIGEAAEAEAQQPSKFLSVQEVQKTLDEAILKN